MHRRLLIAGASVRPYLQSASAAGALATDRFNLESLVAIDLFADWDSAQICPTIRVERLSEIGQVTEQIDFSASIFVGGLEHHPDVLSQLAEHGPVLSPTPESIGSVTDPFELQRAILRHGFQMPDTETTLPSGAGWIEKPRAASGGHQIRLAGQGRKASDRFYQREVAGESISAVYWSNGETTLLVGLTQQLVGIEGLTDRPFAYCGSIGPIRVEKSVESELARFGVCLAREFGLRGVWGADFVLGSDQLHVIEINPRMTASCEILEKSGTVDSLVGAHLAAFSSQAKSIGWATRTPRLHDPKRLIGKAVVYSDLDTEAIVDAALHQNLLRMHQNGLSNEQLSVTTDESDKWPSSVVPDTGPRLADIPTTDSTIPPRGPIATVFAIESLPSSFEQQSTATKEILTRLIGRASSLRSMIGGGLVNI